MNIQRFVLPATLAAAFHAALLYGFPANATRIVEFPLAPLDPPPKAMPVDVIEQPPADIPDPEQPVKPVSGGTPQPDLPDVLRSPDPKQLTIEPEPHQTTKVPFTHIGPKGILGNIDLGGALGTPGIIPSKLLDKEPRAKVQMPPDYPTNMKKDGLDGTVMVEFDVDVKGRVVSARVRHSTDRAFEEPTLRAVLQWRFEPGLSKGLPVPFRMVIPVNFKLGAD